jgi:hypothetical protein
MSRYIAYTYIYIYIYIYVSIFEVKLYNKYKIICQYNLRREYCTGMAVLVGITDQATQSFTLFYYRLHKSSLQSLYYTQYRPPDVLSQSGLSDVFTSRRLA